MEIGIDASSPGFNDTYRALFYGEVIAATVATLWWWTYLVRKGKQIVDVPVSHEVEVRRIAKFWGLISTTSVELTIMASFWPNMDGAWHQTAVRDTALTPAHIPMFFLFFPIGITLTVGTYLYGRYWLPKVYGAENGFPWSFFLLISASVTEMAQVAMNEWGHSLWITEEIFAVPFHWPFVLYGWLLCALFKSDFLQCLLNILHQHFRIFQSYIKAHQLVFIRCDIELIFRNSRTDRKCQ